MRHRRPSGEPQLSLVCVLGLTLHRRIDGDGNLLHRSRLQDQGAQLAQSLTSNDFEMCLKNETLPVRGPAGSLAAALEKEGLNEDEGC